MKCVLASKNRAKLQEMRRILAPLGWELIGEGELKSPLPEVDETGATFAENAMLKARSACKATGLPAIADDSGLCVDVLGGAPGVYSARYAGAHGDDKANNDKLLAELREVSDTRRTAHFACAICCAWPDGRTLTANGRCEGAIGHAARGGNGFGYDPLFVTRFGCFGEMDAAAKDAISHRGAALRAFAALLADQRQDKH